MSQVIVENDEFLEKRLKTAEQERRIQRNAMITKWQMGKGEGLKTVAKLVGYASLPVVAFWAILLVGVGYAIGLAGTVCRFLGGLVR